MNAYPTQNYGDVVLDRGFGQTMRISQGFAPGGDFMPAGQGQRLTQGVVRAMGVQLFKNIQKAWEPHNRTGDSLKRMEIQMGPMSVRISLGGRADANPFMLVEGGFPAHDIHVGPSHTAMHWSNPDEGFAKSVTNPGYAGDPFVERAFQELNYEKMLTSLAEAELSSIGGLLGSMAQAHGGSFQWGQSDTGGSDSSVSDNEDFSNSMDSSI